jgi:hypothetical protein
VAKVVSVRAFGIAGLNIALSVDADLSRLAPPLEPFLVPASSSAPPDLDLQILRAGVEEGVAPVPPPPGEMFMSAHQHEAGLMFRRGEGRLLAGPGFGSCRAWDTREDTPPETFDGRPWLFLALWGYLAHHRGALLHGAVCELDGHFVVLLGRPGAGKSTLGRLVVAAGGTCLTDEYPVLTCREGMIWAHGTPWRGIWGPGRRLSAHLEGMFFLRHAPTDDLQRLDQREGGQRLLQNARFFIWEPATVPDTVELLDRAARTVPVYDFGFVPHEPAVECLRQVL